MRTDTGRGIGTAMRVEGSADEEFVRRALAGERGAWELLLHRHGPRIRRAVGAILRNDDEAEDAVQQAWLHALGGLRSFAGTSTFATWLTRIAVNEALGRIRQRTRHPAAAVDDEAHEDGGRGPEEQAATREGMALLQAALRSLPPLSLRVFVLRELEERTVGETAQELGLTGAAVKTRLHRARRRLRSRLERRAAPAGTGSGRRM